MKSTLMSFCVIVLLLTLLSSCEGPAYVSAEPVVIEEPRPPPPTITHVWIGHDWRWNNQSRSYHQVPGHWSPPHRGRNYQQGNWQTGPKGHHWNRGRWK